MFFVATAVWQLVCIMDDGGYELAQVVREPVLLPTIALCIFIGALAWTLGLFVYHNFLVCVNQTTYEYVKGRYKSVPNPFDQGIIHNYQDRLGTRTPLQFMLRGVSQKNQRQRISSDSRVNGPMAPAPNDSITVAGSQQDGSDARSEEGSRTAQTLSHITYEDTVTLASCLPHFAWRLLTFLVAFLVEFYVLLCLLLVDSFQVTLWIGILFQTITLTSMVTIFARWLIHKPVARWFCLGSDYWPPFPKWEWGEKPLLWNVVSWDPADGWEKMHEAQAVSVTAPPLPSAVVCVCFLLSKQSNAILYESLAFFTSTHTSPIYVMMNAQEAGDWIEGMLRQIATHIAMHYSEEQVKVWFVKDSRSKAANLNAFVEVVGERNFKYAMMYDVDDRPTYNETSLLEYAEEKVGTTVAGFTVAGLQGPCIEAFDDTLRGFIEVSIEWWSMTRSLDLVARVSGGPVRFLGHNLIIKMDILKRQRFNSEILLEDWRWSMDIMEEGQALIYTRAMVSYGQTPPGWRAVLQRRKRWFQGRTEEQCHDAFCRSLRGPAKLWVLAAWWQIFGYLVAKPMLNALSLVGFARIFSRCQSHGNFLVVDVDRLVDEESQSRNPGTLRVAGILWNVVAVAAALIVFGTCLIHYVNEVRNWRSGLFLNGRSTFRWVLLQQSYYFVAAFGVLYKPFTFYQHFEYYCRAECVLKMLMGRRRQWNPTPKKQSHGAPSVIGKRAEVGLRDEDMVQHAMRRTRSADNIIDVVKTFTTTYQADLAAAVTT